MTAQQLKVLNYLKRHIAEHGTSPSYMDILEGCDLASKSQVHNLLKALEAHGHIKRAPFRARAIEIVVKTCPHCGGSL